MNLTLSPSLVAENIDRSRSGMSRRVDTLTAGGRVEKAGRGMYEITRTGDDVIEKMKILDIPDPEEELPEE